MQKNLLLVESLMSKILIVEDEIIEAMSFEQSLKSLNYDVVGIASTGEDALHKVAQLDPDLVLMDIVLKGEMDGIDTATYIKIIMVHQLFTLLQALKRVQLTVPSSHHPMVI